MLGVGANDHYPTTTADNTALFAHFFNRCSDFHVLNCPKYILSLHRFIMLAKFDTPARNNSHPIANRVIDTGVNCLALQRVILRLSAPTKSRFDLLKFLL